MKRRRMVCWALYAALTAGVTAGACRAQAVRLESAQMGTAGRIGGNSITTAQYTGWRFSISEPLAVQSVGGHLGSIPDEPGDIFAALVRLDSIDAMPHGEPFTQEEVVATTLFRSDFPSSEFFTPLTATLTPGDYALVYGTGLFGANGAGFLHNGPDQPDIPPTNISSFIYWGIPFFGQPPVWRTNLASMMRFVIDAEVIHLPGNYDGNLQVDAADYDEWKTDFGETTDLDADGNGNLVVDAADYTIWRDHLGATVTGAAAAVPEPASLLLLLIAVTIEPCLATSLNVRYRSRWPWRSGWGRPRSRWLWMAECCG